MAAIGTIESAQSPHRERVTIRDGSRIWLQPLGPDDKPALQEGLSHLSSESHYCRFTGPKDRLTEHELDYYTLIDHPDHETLIAFGPDGMEPIGVARFIREKHDPNTAEVAVAVVDSWHGRGVGTALLERLAGRARLEGIERFNATVLAENRDVSELLETLGAGRVGNPACGLLELEMDLTNRVPGQFSLRPPWGGVATPGREPAVVR